MSSRSHEELGSEARALWRASEPLAGEAARWQCVDGRWISITRGHGASADAVLVLDSYGRCEAVATFEEAAALATTWQGR